MSTKGCCYLRTEPGQLFCFIFTVRSSHLTLSNKPKKRISQNVKLFSLHFFEHALTLGCKKHYIWINKDLFLKYIKYLLLNVIENHFCAVICSSCHSTFFFFLVLPFRLLTLQCIPQRIQRAFFNYHIKGSGYYFSFQYQFCKMGVCHSTVFNTT